MLFEPPHELGVHTGEHRHYIWLGYRITCLYSCLDRTKKVKEARDEAKKEIDAYKKEKEESFKKFESEVRLALLSSTFLRKAYLPPDSRSRERETTILILLLAHEW